MGKEDPPRPTGTARRMVKLYDFHLDDNEEVYSVRRAVVNSKKKKKYDAKPQLKYGVQVPKNVKQAMEFDKENNNTLWEDSIKLEIKALTDLECFDFKDPDYVCGPDYQKTTLTMIFDDLQCKTGSLSQGSPCGRRTSCRLARS